VRVLALRTRDWSIVLAVGFALAALPAGATTLVRRGLDALTHDSESVVHVRVLDLHSYWNADHSLILTDVRARSLATLKGDPAESVEFTVLGGTVGALTTLIVGGPDLAPGEEYVVFLAHVDLPGAATRWSVRDLSQGVFDVVDGRAVSQAAREGLVADAEGRTEAPGGPEGLALGTLVQQVRDLR
jgi:hypothetical protein